MFILNVYLCVYFNCALVSSSFLPKKMFHVSNPNKQKHKALCRAGAFNLQRTAVASVQPGEGAPRKQGRGALHPVRATHTRASSKERSFFISLVVYGRMQTSARNTASLHSNHSNNKDRVSVAWARAPQR